MMMVCSVFLTSTSTHNFGLDYCSTLYIILFAHIGFFVFKIGALTTYKKSEFFFIMLILAQPSRSFTLTLHPLLIHQDTPNNVLTVGFTSKFRLVHKTT